VIDQREKLFVGESGRRVAPLLLKRGLEVLGDRVPGGFAHALRFLFVGGAIGASTVSGPEVGEAVKVAGGQGASAGSQEGRGSISTGGAASGGVGGDGA